MLGEVSPLSSPATLARSPNITKRGGEAEREAEREAEAAEREAKEGACQAMIHVLGGVLII
jgi:hypothetical protein